MILLNMRGRLMDIAVGVHLRHFAMSIRSTARWPDICPNLTEAIEDTVRPWEQATWWETQIETWHEPHPAGVFNEDF